MAAGQGTRLGAGRPKGLVPLGRGPHQEPIVVHALRGALRCAAVTHVVVVAPPDPAASAEVRDALGPVVERSRRVDIQVVSGGAERSDSVAQGLRALPEAVDVVLVHDAARALTPVDVFDRVVAAVRDGHPAVTPAVPVADTIKQVTVLAAGEAGPGGDGPETVVATLDRSSLRAVQTPQGFRRQTLERAHARAGAAGATDDCGMVEALGIPVIVVAGSPRAMKITTASDLAVATGWLEQTGAAVPSTAAAGPSTAVPPVLVVLSGLPGVGKTSLARALCRRLGAAHLRVDTIEQGLLRGGLPETDLFAQGYAAAYAVAADQLAVGLPVVADMVNGVDEARAGWERVGAEAGARVVRVLVECSDADAHRRRVEGRAADIPGHRLPDWEQARGRELAPWPEAHLRVDTATLAAEDAATRVLDVVSRVRDAVTSTEEAVR